MADNKIVPDNKKEPDHSSYTTTPNDLDPGLTANVVDCSETPKVWYILFLPSFFPSLFLLFHTSFLISRILFKMFIDRVLIDGEFVISNFDVKFPGEFLPMWMIITYLIATLGLYGIILLFRFIRRCCYRNRCCTPDTVHFAFGKMVITNKGRIICWKEEIYQKKIDDKYKGHLFCCYIDGCIASCYRGFIFWCIKPCWPQLCQAPVKYAFAQESRMYRASGTPRSTTNQMTKSNVISTYPLRCEANHTIHVKRSQLLVLL